MRKLNKKATVAVATATAVALGGGVAYAYWTTTGSGSGSATTAASNGTLALSATFEDGLTPGATVPVAYKASNAGTSNLYISTFGATVATSETGCDPAWFTVTHNVGAQNVEAGANNAPIGSGTLTFNDDTAVNQDACKSAMITLNLTSS